MSASGVEMGVDGHGCKEKGRSPERPLFDLSPYFQNISRRGGKMPTLLGPGGV